MRIVGNDPTLSRQITATASGAISAAGKPLLVNTDGTVKFAGQETLAQSLGSSVQFESGTPSLCRVVFDTNTNRIVVIYAKNTSGSGYGTAVVGTVSGSSISFGTPVVFESADCSDIDATFHVASNKIVIAYKDNDNSLYGTAIVGTVDSSDNSISFGTAAVFESANSSNIGCASDLNDTSSGKVLISYVDQGNSNYGTSVMATVSGTSISFSSPVVFESASTSKTRVAYSTNHGKWAIGFIDVGDSSKPKAIICENSSGSPSFSGSATAVESGATTGVYDVDVVWVRDTAQGGNVLNLALIYEDNSNQGFVSISTVSGVSINDLGAGQRFASSSTGSGDFNGPYGVYDTQFDKLVIAYADTGDSSKLSVITATLRGTTLTYDTEVTSSFSTVSNVGIGFDSSVNKSVIAFKLTGASHTGGAAVFQASGTQENLTTENFIGTSAHAAADGAKVLVNTQGAIDENQSGLTAGQTFFVDKNGALQLTTNVSASLGSTSTTIPASSGTGIGYASGTFDSSNGKVVVTFQDQGDGNKAKARVGTVDTSDNSISFGTIATAPNNAASNYPFATFDSNSNKVVFLYADDGNNGYGTGAVGTVSGTDISFGSETVFESANTYYISATFDSSNNKVVVAYSDGGNSNYGTAVVGTVSGTSISFGTPVVFESASAGFESVVFDSSNNKVVIAYRDDGNSNYGTAIVGTVSGTSISFGSPTVYHSTNSLANMIAFDSTNNKVVIAYKDNSDSSKGKAVVGTVSGTSISFGSPAVFEAGAIVTSGNTGIGIVYDSNAEKIVIHYEDSGDSNYSKLIVGTVSGTSISFAGELTTYTTNTTYQNAIFDSTNNRVVLVWNNFAKVYSNAEDLSGSLSHDAVTAGTALSATKLLVKG